MSTETPRTSKAAQSEATRSRLLAAARSLFAERGYAHVGTEEIVRAAGVTRGALYHQFADKRDLFAAVFEELEGELITEAAGRMVGHDDPLAAMKEACRGWLEACARPEAQQIVLLDAPAVLGYETWREIGERHGLRGGGGGAPGRGGVVGGGRAPHGPGGTRPPAGPRARPRPRRRPRRGGAVRRTLRRPKDRARGDGRRALAHGRLAAPVAGRPCPVSAGLSSSPPSPSPPPLRRRAPRRSRR